MIIQKAIKNQVFFNYPGDLTDKIVFYRFKKKKEDVTEPLLEGAVTIFSTSESKSECYFYLDLSQSEDLKSLIGQAWIDFLITYDDDPCPIITLPIQLEIVTTLKGY